MKYGPIRLAVVLEAEEIPAWQSHLIEQTLKEDHLHVSVYLADASDRRGHAHIRTGAIYEAFLRREYRRHRLDPDACQSVPVSHLFDEQNVSNRPDRTALIRACGWEELCSALEEGAVDVILSLGWLHALNELANLAKYGAWYFTHDCGQTRKVDGASIGIWEALTGCAYTRSALVVRMPEKADGRLVCESYSTVDFSEPLRSRNEHLWKILFFVPRALRFIHENGPADFLAHLDVVEGLDEMPEKNSSRSLTDRSLFLPVLRYAIRRVYLKWSRMIFEERWELMYSTSEKLNCIDKFKSISPPAGRFWADPFVLQREGSHFLFFEDASVATGHGHISVLRINEEGDVEAPQNVLARPYHLSYPYVFEWDDEIYMVPETGDNRTIELYRCVSFPYQWEFVHNLLDEIDAYDATLVEHGQLWWMFANVRQHAGASTWDELCIFYSDSPISQNWRPHPNNPVVSDVRSARPAGRFFTKDNCLYRPSQDSSIRYGYALNINQVLRLSESEYREEIIRKVKPNWSRKFKAVHTLNSVNGITVIDVIRRFPKLRALRRK